MLTVGIHEDIVVKDAKINDKGSVILTLAQQAEEVGELDFLEGTGDSEAGENKADFYFYGLSNTDFQGNPMTADDIKKSIKELRFQFFHILKPFYTEADITFNSVQGTGITAENADQKILDQSVLDTIFKNLADRFIELLTPHFNSEETLRALFIRRSQAKHFPALRRRFLDSQPFLESMKIPKEQSKLKFSKYEIEKGLDSGTPIEEEPDEEAMAATNSGNSMDDLLGT